MGACVFAVLFNLVGCQFITDEWQQGVALTPGWIKAYIINGLICFNLCDVCILLFACHFNSVQEMVREAEERNKRIKANSTT